MKWFGFGLVALLVVGCGDSIEKKGGDGPGNNTDSNNGGGVNNTNGSGGANNTNGTNNTSGSNNTNNTNNTSGSNNTNSSNNTNGSNNTNTARCPVPQAVLSANGGVTRTRVEVSIGDEVQLDGSASLSPDGIEIAAWQWEVVAAPPGSNASILSVGALATFSPDVPGNYEISLEVEDVEGNKGCQSDEVFIVAAASDLLVKVTWDTPADPDQTDALGTDMDIHILYPGGQWNMLPYDCYWNNRGEDDWGTPGPAGDCSFDLDDSNGMGPEQASIREADGVTYKVGVHYYETRSFGASTATLELFHNGVKIYTGSKTLNARDDFWYVGDYDAASATLSIVDSVSTGFP